MAVNNIITDFEKQAEKCIFAENVKNGKIADIHIFRDFEQENSALRIYDIWNFSKATNEVSSVD